MLKLWSHLGEDCSQLQVASYTGLGWEGAGTKVGGAAGSLLGTGTPSALRAVRRVGKESLADARQGLAGSRGCTSVRSFPGLVPEPESQVPQAREPDA